MASGNSTAHHRIHGITGFLTIITLPIVLYKLVGAVPNGAEGFTDWLSAPVGALSLLVFMSAALWYCKLEFDEVIMDYGRCRLCHLQNLVRIRHDRLDRSYI